MISIVLQLLFIFSFNYFYFTIIKIGTADWHYLRKLSLTSSQAHMAFKKAFIAYKCEPAWLAVAVYLYGNDWRSALNITDPVPVPTAGASAADADAGAASQEEEDLRHTRSVHDYVTNLPIPEEDDDVAQDALDF